MKVQIPFLESVFLIITESLGKAEECLEMKMLQTITVYPNTEAQILNRYINHSKLPLFQMQ